MNVFTRDPHEILARARRRHEVKPTYATLVALEAAERRFEKTPVEELVKGRS